jgi:hypothetical protein
MKKNNNNIIIYIAQLWQLDCSIEDWRNASWWEVYGKSNGHNQCQP